MDIWLNGFKLNPKDSHVYSNGSMYLFDPDGVA